MYGGDFSGWCCASCLDFDTKFRGGYWGGVPFGGKFYLTRQPEFLKEANWLSTLNADAIIELPDIEEGGVTYRCVSVAASQYGDATFLKSGAHDGVVWFQTNWAPLDDLSTTTPRAGLAVVEVFTEQEIGVAEPIEQTLVDSWLVNDAGGSPEHWDSEEKLCHYFRSPETATPSAKKTCCGVDQFVLYERRVAGQAKVTYWNIGDADPVVQTWTNPEDVTTNSNTWRVAYVSKHHFPLCLWQRTTIDLFGGGGLNKVEHHFRISTALLPSMAINATHIESNEGVGLPAIVCQRTTDLAPAMPLADYRVVLGDWDSYGTNFKPAGVAIFSYPDSYEGSSNFTNSFYKWDGVGAAGVPHTQGESVTTLGFTRFEGDSVTPDRLPTDFSKAFEAQLQSPLSAAVYAWHSPAAPVTSHAAVLRVFTAPQNMLTLPRVVEYRADGASGQPFLDSRGFPALNVAGGILMPGVPQLFDHTTLNVQFANDNFTLEGGGDLQPIGVVENFPTWLTDADAPFGFGGARGVPVGRSYLGDSTDPDPWNDLAFPPSGLAVTSRVYDHWFCSLNTIWPMYQSHDGGDLKPQGPPRGTWYDTLGVKHEDGPLCWDGSKDSLHPDDNWAENP